MLPHGELVKLAAEFGVSRQCVWRALKGEQRATPLLRVLRKAAIERGGMEYDPGRRARATQLKQLTIMKLTVSLAYT